MTYKQGDLFAQDEAERNILPEAQRIEIRAKLEATLARLQQCTLFPWKDRLDAAHEENRFERECGRLGDEGPAFWARFDVEMDRLFATQVFPDDPVEGESPS